LIFVIYSENAVKKAPTQETFYKSYPSNNKYNQVCPCCTEKCWCPRPKPPESQQKP